jgi:hypothetical protein
LWCRSGLWYAGVDLQTHISTAATSMAAKRVSATHMYFTGRGLPSVSAAGTSSLGREVWNWGISVSSACLVGWAGGGFDILSRAGKVDTGVVTIRFGGTLGRLGGNNMGKG